jgi:hypothetical protein
MHNLAIAAILGIFLTALTLPVLADHPCKPGEVRDKVTKECKAKK